MSNPPLIRTGSAADQKALAQWMRDEGQYQPVSQRKKILFRIVWNLAQRWPEIATEAGPEMLQLTLDALTEVAKLEPAEDNKERVQSVIGGWALTLSFAAVEASRARAVCNLPTMIAGSGLSWEPLDRPEDRSLVADVIAQTLRGELCPEAARCCLAALAGSEALRDDAVAATQRMVCEAAVWTQAFSSAAGPRPLTGEQAENWLARALEVTGKDGPGAEALGEAVRQDASRAPALTAALSRSIAAEQLEPGDTPSNRPRPPRKRVDGPERES